MPRSPTAAGPAGAPPERDSVPPVEPHEATDATRTHDARGVDDTHDGGDDAPRQDRSTERKLIAASAVDADSTGDAAQEDFLFHLYRGSEMLQENRVLEAKEELEYALTLQPKDAKGQDLLAAVYFRLGLFARAITIYEQLEKLFPRDTSLKINLALSHMKTGHPEIGRTALHEVVRINPNHRRAWGYLGVANEKIGDFDQAQVAFERGGHTAMAKRMAERRNRVTVPAPAMPSTEADADAEVREVAGMAFEELDAGELDFALAEPHTSSKDVGTWHAVELGVSSRALHDGRARSPYAKTLSPPSIRETPGEALTVSPPPAALGAMTRTPLPPSNRGPLVANPTPVISVPPPEMTQLARESLLAFPEEDAVLLHPSGVALVQTHVNRGFAARLEAMRMAKGTLTTVVMQRRTRDKDTGEVLGGVGSPLVSLEGEGELVLGPRPAHQLFPLALHDELAFVREDLLLGFELRLGYENGRLVIDDGEPLGIVQLRGTGTLVLELLASFVTVDATAGRAVMIRRDWIVGWIGRLVPRALPSSEAPAGQRGLVNFSGEGTVLMAGR